MLNKIIRFSIENKLIIGLMVFLLIAIGSYQFTKLPIDAVPDITDNQVQVITSSPAFSAPDIERFITFPIEQSLRNIPGIKQIRSFSRFGLSVITVVFEENVDVYWARQQVADRLTTAKNEIPPGVGNPEIAPLTTGLGEVYQYILHTKPGFESTYSATELRTLQDWIVRRQLLGVEGVADVASFGGLLKQYEIALSPDRLNAMQLTYTDIFDALEKNNQNTGGAYIEKNSTALYIRSEGMLKNIADIENILIKKMSDGTNLLLKDIAEVKISHAIRYGAMTYNGKGEVAGAVVMMLKGANSNKVIANVKNKIAEIQHSLPEGVVIEPFLDRTKMVNNAISTVAKNLMEGALIVIFVLVLFLGNFRAGFIVASVIPLSMLFAVSLMNMFGVSGNLMSLGALDFGLIIDGAVIIVEAVMHSLFHSKNSKLTQQQMDDEVNLSASRMMNSAVFGQIIILIVYIPIFTLEGVEGKMFKPMAQTVAFALLGAFILSLTYVPMMSALFLSKNISHKQTTSDKMMVKLETFFSKILNFVLGKQKLVVAIVGAALIAAVIVLSFMGGEFIPELPEGDFAIDTRVLTGSSLTTSIEANLKSQQLLLSKFPEIEKIVSKTGSSEIPTDPMPIEASDMMVILKPRAEWTSADNYEDLIEKMSKTLEDIPGVTYSFQYPVAMRFNELMTGAKQDVVCKIFGENLDTLAKYATQLGKISEQVKGAENIYVEPIAGMPQIVINYNRDALAAYGVAVEEVNRAVNMAFAGQSAGLLYEEEKKFDLVVRLDNKNKKDIADVKNLLIKTENGLQVPLSSVAIIDMIEGPNQIQRENTHRRIIVGFNVRNRDIQSTVADLQQLVNTNIKLPAGYYLTYGGTFEKLQAAKTRLGIAVPISLILIFIMLYFAFNSFKYSALIYTAIPLSIIGGVFALFFRGMPFSISAGVGFIALFGVAVLNGIVLIAEFNRLKKDGMTDVEKIVKRGTKVRLRPVLMTACVASLGFLPMALSNGEGAQVQRPLATVVIGGLVVATLLTLFVLPILYIWFEKGVKSKSPQNIAAVVLLFGISISGFSQDKISLQAATDSAVLHNKQIAYEQLNSQYLQQKIKEAVNLPTTAFSVEVGQINSTFIDNKFSIQQGFKFPTYYTLQKKLLQQEFENSITAKALKEIDITNQLAVVYTELIFLEGNQLLLNDFLNIYQQYADKATLRQKAGESNMAEKASAIAALTALKIKKAENEQNIKQFQFLLQLLMNSDNSYLPIEEKLKIKAVQVNGAPNSHPALLLLEKQKNMAAQRLKIAKQAYLPDFILGYNNMTMRGTGADDKKYTSQRFQSGQIGVGIPLFFGAARAGVKAEQINLKLANAKYDIAFQEQTVQQKIAYAQMEAATQQLHETEELLKNEIKTIQTVNEAQLKQGEINYLQWVFAMNQVFDGRQAYLTSLKKYNLAVVQLNYFLTR